VFALWAFFASGLVFQVIDPIVRWYAGQVHLGPSPSVTP
jgi:hypothetical protein